MPKKSQESWLSKNAALRKSGVGLFVELHVLVRGETTVRESHNIGHEEKDHLLAKKTASSLQLFTSNPTKAEPTALFQTFRKKGLEFLDLLNAVASTDENRIRCLDHNEMIHSAKSNKATVGNCDVVTRVMLND